MAKTRAARRVKRQAYHGRTAAQRAALRKAQLASARKRKGHGQFAKRAAVGVGVATVLGASVYAGHKGRTAVVRHKGSGSKLDIQLTRNQRNGHYNISAAHPRHLPASAAHSVHVLTDTGTRNARGEHGTFSRHLVKLHGGKHLGHYGVNVLYDRKELGHTQKIVGGKVVTQNKVDPTKTVFTESQLRKNKKYRDRQAKAAKNAGTRTKRKKKS